MDEFPLGKEPSSEKDSKDVSRTVVEVADGSSVEPAGEKEDTSVGQEPPEIVKTPQSFEDGLQHTSDPQKLEEDKKYTF